MRRPPTGVSALIVFGLGAALGFALWPGAASLWGSLAPGPHPDELAPPGHLPAFLKDAPEQTLEIYRWAAAHADLLRFIPCYCGCATMGHDSNAACYLRGLRPDGKIWYERHGARCGGCLVVTREVMALHRRGTPAREIRRMVEIRHAREGPSTPTLWPPR